MMSTAPPWQLSREQAERLLRYMQEYRRYTLTSMPPTQERNTILRLIQALQGRLLALIDRNVQQIDLPLVKEDAVALKAMARGLLSLYEEKPDSLERAITITDVRKLHTYLKQIYR